MCTVCAQDTFPSRREEKKEKKIVGSTDSCRDGNGLGLDLVDQKSNPQRNRIGWKIALAPKPVGEISHPHLHQSGAYWVCKKWV
jgi:hypothetical protein